MGEYSSKAQAKCTFEKGAFLVQVMILKLPLPFYAPIIFLPPGVQVKLECHSGQANFLNITLHEFLESHLGAGECTGIRKTH